MSEQFNIGDDVIVVNDQYIWLDPLPHDTVLTVINDSDDGSYVNDDEKTIEIQALRNWPEDFQVVSKPKEYATGGLTSIGNTYGLVGEQCSDYVIAMTSIEKEETVIAEDISRFVEDRVKEIIKPELGVYRPQLETRKVGKVPMHMVIDGFPRALREVAKVMGWAADIKGYKLHDWKNLPDADIEFPSAGNRHMIDNSIMKSEGTSAIERVDHESNLVHLAHEVFNKLAELELILTGKIK